MRFDLLRAAFWLLALMVAATMFLVAVAVISCTINVAIGTQPPGTCIKAGIADELHNLWTEMLTAILALLAIGRGSPPPSPPPSDD